MGDDGRIRISREEVYAKAVDEALAAVQAVRRTALTEPPELPPLRRLLHSKLFYLTVAGFIGSFLAWAILEPMFQDFEILGGEVNLINREPWMCPAEAQKCMEFTVGHTVAMVFPGETRLERGADGQPAFVGLHHVVPGTYLEVVGGEIEPGKIGAMAVRPATPERAKATGHKIEGEFTPGRILLFPLTAVLIVLFIFLAEGVSDRHWRRTVSRSLVGTSLTLVFACLAFVPAGAVLLLGEAVLNASLKGGLFVTVDDLSPISFVLFTASRSMCWAVIGMGIGLGMNLVRSTKLQLRNSILGGALGGAFGGMFFDPIDRFLGSASAFEGGDLSRVIGVCMVGAAVGFFVALSEHLAREAWLLVRTGPLAGKSFVLYRSPTVLGSSTQADIYLFKDADIDPEQAAIHRVGNTYEIEDLGSRTGAMVNGAEVRRSRLASGDQIVLGNTVLDFEERVKHG